MAMTAAVKDELSRLSITKTCCRRAEVSALLRFGGGLHIVNGRVVVDRAPALFLIPCGDSRCADSEHDLTRAVMQALRAHESRFQGTDECSGSVGTSACGRSKLSR